MEMVLWGCAGIGSECLNRPLVLWLLHLQLLQSNDVPPLLTICGVSPQIDKFAMLKMKVL
jgi:hypothetical protein